MTRAFAAALAAALVLGGAACDASKARPLEPTTEVVADCARCHGYPPPPNGPFIMPTTTSHPTSSECSACHPGTVAADNHTIIAGGDHMNGVVDAVGAAHPLPFGAAHQTAALGSIASCTACHGADYGGGAAESCNACHANLAASGPDWKTNCTFCHGTRTADVTIATAKAAPPQSVAGTGIQDRTNARVGAHQAHLGLGTVSNAMACESCHAVPSGAQALTHFSGDGSPAPVTFANGAFATKGAGAPAYTGGTCAVYCHGAGTEFGSPANKASPTWTSTGVTCTTCHGNPPASGPTISGQNAHAFHVVTQAQSCARCHGTGYSTSTVDKAKHVNGTKDVVASAAWDCSQCHTALGVTVAHPLPFVADHTGSALASIASCTACHGADYNGGSAQSCTACHASQIAAGGAGWTTNCTFCHGTRTAGVTTATTTSAPPQSVAGTGTQDRTNARIGAHQAHLVQGAIAGAMPCASCHAVPSGAQALTHFNAYDGTSADVTFANSAFATKGVTGATYAGGTCAVYCHGTGSEFGSPAGKASPAWTSTGVTCTTCHGYPPASHDAGSTNCNACHSGTVDTNNTTIKVAGGLHVNGVKEATGAHPAGWGDKTQHGYYANANGLTSCKGCHGSTLAGGSGRACSACHGAGWDTNCTFCHGTVGGSAAPPVDTQGRNVTTNVSVGLHTSHVTTTMATPLTCAQCHPARTTSVITDAAHIDGSANGADVSMGALARTGGAAANYNRTSATAATCSSVYCHGTFTGGVNSGAGATPSWTSGTVGCTSCHGNPPSTGQHGRHSSLVACSGCHGNSGSGATHVNGTKNVPLASTGATSGTPTWSASSRTCGTFTCHGKSHNTGDNW